MRFAGILMVILCATVIPPEGAAAHEVRPGFLDLRETEANVFQMTWKVPALGAFRLSLEPRFPEACGFIGEPITLQTGGAFVEHVRVHCEHGLRGERIAIRGLGATQTDVLARIEGRDGFVECTPNPVRARSRISARPNWYVVVKTYVGLGIEHILFGIDHLLFVFCLLLLVHDTRKLLLTVTAFTAAHSVTLTAATLGFLNVPSAPVEATIALSIVFLACEFVRAEAYRSEVTRSYPWLVAFMFGLSHGFGFAGALADVGLPHGEIPLALFAFNIGVELGQLAFIALVLWVRGLARVFLPNMPAWAPPVAGYAIGTTASFWVFARLSAVM